VFLTADLRDFGILMNAPELADGLWIQTVADFLVAQAPGCDTPHLVPQQQKPTLNPKAPREYTSP
jgi:hypothetical protein